jgi:putative salt-induced outer membrane protein YdiY
MRNWVTGLVLALALLGGRAEAQLEAAYRALLETADANQDDAAFRETARMIALTTPGGEAEVHAAIAADLPHRLALVADWAPVVDAPLLAEADAPSAAAAIEAGEVEEADDPHRGRLARFIPSPGDLPFINRDAWAGQVSLGVQLANGNTELSDYAFKLHLDRETTETGWGIASKFEYYYTETDARVTRDNWLVSLRGERQLVDRWGYYVGGSYESDNLSSFERSAYLTGGGTFQAIDREGMSWDLRAGIGVRFNKPNDPAEPEETNAIAEFGSDFAWALTETTDFEAETLILAGGSSRFEQRFGVVTSLGGSWSLQTGVRVRHDADPSPGREATDTRFDIAIAREF